MAGTTAETKEEKVCPTRDQPPTPNADSELGDEWDPWVFPVPVKTKMKKRVNCPTIPATPVSAAPWAVKSKKEEEEGPSNSSDFGVEHSDERNLGRSEYCV